MKIQFHTNLDEAKPFVDKLTETWKGPVPAVDHLIIFAFERWNHDITPPKYEKRNFSLVVCAVRWDETGEPAVELHAPRNFESIQKWMDYFRRHVQGRA